MDLDQEKQNKIILQKEMLGDIGFQNVNFRYGSRIEVFKDFNLLIMKGEITAIVGESGSGKSTLIHLLQNIYPLVSGKIYINNIDITQFDNYSLRRIVGVIPQKVELFKGTIIENIAIGEFEPDMNKILKISQDIGLIKFIEELPEGFFTDIGENGTSLSGGQRQKIAFARVLYREPEILILDEASSSLDSESEEQIMNVIHRLKEQGKTIIMIAHRLSTVLNADSIIVLEKGVVKENGSHTELYNNKQRYYNLWQKQIPILEG
jgi:ATP-binding cassette subfamily B protein